MAAALLSKIGDRLRGFAYFETFDEARDWSEDDVDPLQRSNTPLLRSPPSAILPTECTSNVMLIHDYSGGYHPYEACQGAVVDADEYSCDYLQYVETFVYFSHKLISIPPPTWINTCHRNGVKILGTFLVEPGSSDVQRILEKVDGSYWLADKLAQMAKSYGFDGWLINIERIIPVAYWSVVKLEEFLKQLRTQLSDGGKVVWYDALITLDVVWYQNSLTRLNLPFALAAGSILTNYAWTPELGTKALALAKSVGLPAENVYFGIDVWAQNVQHGPNRRLTWPRDGGGGTGTGLGVKELASMGFGSGIFGPAWSFEHFSGHGRAVERAIWQGQNLPDSITCECGSILQHSGVHFMENPASRFASQRPAGSRSFFYTDFRRALSRIQDRPNIQSGRPPHWASLGQQSVLPCNRKAPFHEYPSACLARGESDLSPICELVAESNHNPTRCSIIVHTHDATPRYDRKNNSSEITATLMLFNINVPVGGDYDLEVTYRKPRVTQDCTIGIMIAEEDAHVIIQPLPVAVVHHGHLHRRLQTHESTADNVKSAYIGIGVHVRGPRGDITDMQEPLVELLEIALKPRHCQQKKPQNICNVRVERREICSSTHYRLVWDVLLDSESDTSDVDSNEVVPYSKVTGPYSHFIIAVNGEDVGVAFAVEFVLYEDVVRSLSEAGILDVVILGIGFDGQQLQKVTAQISWLEAELVVENGWLMVDRQDIDDCETAPMTRAAARLHLEASIAQPPDS